MKSRSPLSRFTFLLCFFAVLGAQLFGVTRGYLCDCSGKKVSVQTTGCSGPHGENCHAKDAQHSGSHDEKNDGDRKEHEQVKEDLKGTSLSVPSLAIPAPTILAVLPELLLSILPARAVSLAYLAEPYDAPPPGIAVARTVVLLL